MKAFKFLSGDGTNKVLFPEENWQVEIKFPLTFAALKNWDALYFACKVVCRLNWFVLGVWIKCLPIELRQNVFFFPSVWLGHELEIWQSLLKCMARRRSKREWNNGGSGLSVRKLSSDCSFWLASRLQFFCLPECMLICTRL